MIVEWQEFLNLVQIVLVDGEKKTPIMMVSNFVLADLQFKEDLRIVLDNYINRSSLSLTGVSTGSN